VLHGLCVNPLVFGGGGVDRLDMIEGLEGQIADGGGSVTKAHAGRSCGIPP
jgi:hypothetical protein